MPKESVQEIFSDLIDLPERQMRRDIDRDELHALSENIKTNGLISPLTVRPVGERFELVAGQRRLLACRIAGIIRIPCVVRDLSDASALDIMAAENLERRDVDLVDEANFIALVMKTQEQSVAQMATRLNRSEQYVRDRILVAEMPDYMQQHLKSGGLKLGVALALLEIEPDEKRQVWVALAVRDNCTMREVSWWVHNHRLGLLPAVESGVGELGSAPTNAPKEQLFEDALTGERHPVGEFTTLLVHRSSMPYLDALRIELRKSPAESESASGPDIAPAPVGAGAG